MRMRNLVFDLLNVHHSFRATLKPAAQNGF